MAARGRLAHYFADERRASHVRLGIYLVFIALCLIGGGGSRDDILSLLYLRPAAALCLGAILLVPGRIDFASVRVPFWLLVALTLWLVLQLVPLPPGLWASLPGREPIVEGAAVLGLAQPWRPISMAPDLTLNSLAAMVVPFTALVGFAALDQKGRELLLPVLIGAALLSALLGIAQLSGGAQSAFYLYRITNEEAAVGLFANRNHQAVLLALTFPMLALWTAQAGPDPDARRIRLYIAVPIGLFLVPMILVTGSRGGLILGGLAAIWASFQYLKERRVPAGARGFGWKAPAAALLALFGIGAAFAYLASTRAVALQRLLRGEENELRLNNLPVFAEMARDMFPFGTGLGAFDPVYRIYERHEALSPRYLNHAHNDLLELVITGGLPALLVLLLFLAWWAWCCLAAFRSWRRSPGRIAYARLGAVMLLLLLLGSLFDYPLRVPILAVVFAIACGWLGSAREKPAND